MWACGYRWRSARRAGSDMTASPTQLVARTNILLGILSGTNI